MPSTVIDSPIGPLRVVAEAGALTRIDFFDDHPEPPDGPAVSEDHDPALGAAAEQLREYFDGRRTSFDLPLAPRGTPFQRRVWDALRMIPYASTWTYGRLASEIGSPTAARAVGAANGQNPLAVIVPCHRVIGSNGTLTGYAGGLERKRTLLDLEASSLRLV